MSPHTSPTPSTGVPLDPDGVLAALVADAPPLSEAVRSRLAALLEGRRR